MTKSKQETERYLKKTLGIRTELREWNQGVRLPLFLREGYQFFETELLGTSCLLMFDRSKQAPSPGAIRKHMMELGAKANAELIYVRQYMDYYQRDRLIAQHIPFIVPGNQLYLPMLGVDLREHFRKQREKSDALMPATQTLVLRLLLRPNEELGTPAEYAERLGYTKMTMTRAFNELQDQQLCDVFKEGRERRLRLIEERSDLWNAALPLLIDPVKQRRTIHDWRGSHEHPRASLTALASCTMLDEPNPPAVALSSKAWKILSEREDVARVPADELDSIEVEVWRYDPNLFACDGRVDHLSLYLSLRETADERIETALEELMEKMPW